MNWGLLNSSKEMAKRFFSPPDNFAALVSQQLDIPIVFNISSIYGKIVIA